MRPVFGWMGSGVCGFVFVRSGSGSRNGVEYGGRILICRCRCLRRCYLIDHRQHVPVIEGRVLLGPRNWQ